MSESAALSATLEDYLEAVSRLIAEKGRVRVLDIADALSVHKSTVTAALKSLTEKGLINYSPYESATLTAEGQEAANEIARRHEVVRRFLMDVLSLRKDVAEANACRMEHVLDKEVLDRLHLLCELVRESLPARADWSERLQHYLGESKRQRAKEPAPRQRQKESEKVMTTLNQLKPGEKAKIVRVGSLGAVRRRIVDMGVVRGTPIEVVKVAPLGDPIEVKVKGYSLSLRKEEAATITVEPE